MAYEGRTGDYQGGHGGGYDGAGAGRGRGRRPVTDYGSTMVQWMRNRRPRHKGRPIGEVERPSASFIIDMLPPAADLMKPADAIPAKHLHASLNKIKHPINLVRWTPEGRRLLTGSSSGEFTLWNGMGFNFETIMQAHDAAIRAASYSHSDDWLVSADQDGVVKYWQPNFNNVKAIQAHNDPIRDLAFSPTDTKFVTASDDSTLKIFDFAAGVEEIVLNGHQWDVKAVDWHPTKGLLVSGSKDHQVKLWDPRTTRCLTTLHGHKNAIAKTKFEPNRGQLLATCGRDQTARVFDLRMMRDIVLLKGHEKDISTLTWHPIHVSLLTTGGSDGSLFHYLLDEPNAPTGTTPSIPPYESPDPSNAPAQTIYPAHRIQYAHDFSIWSLDWHPLGHILASGSNDRVTRFWTRARPGETDCFTDRYHVGEEAAAAQGTWDRRGGRKQRQEEEEMEMEDEADGLVDQKMPARQSMLPGLPGLPVPASAFSDGTSVGGSQNIIPGMNSVPPPPPGGLPGLRMPGLDPNHPPDLTQLAAMMGSLPPPPPPMGNGAQGFPPPPPLPGTFPNGVLPPGLLPPGFQLPPGFPPPPPLSAAGGVVPGMNGDGNGVGAGGIRRRVPLPSQQESLAEEQRRGKFRIAR